MAVAGFIAMFVLIHTEVGRLDTKIKARTENLDVKISGVEATVRSEVGRLDARSDRLDAKIDTQSARIDQLGIHVEEHLRTHIG
jgi:hypothetical protein